MNIYVVAEYIYMFVARLKFGIAEIYTSGNTMATKEGILDCSAKEDSLIRTRSCNCGIWYGSGHT